MNADSQKSRDLRSQAPYTREWQGRAGKETGAKSPASTTEQPKGFRSATLPTVEYSDRIGKASGCRYEVVPTGYSTPYQHAAPYHVAKQPNFDKACAHLEYGEHTRHFQQRKPTEQMMTKEPLGEAIFERAKHPMFSTELEVAGAGGGGPEQGGGNS
mmetsp:Transcript_18688/g.46695  ORF Transcript_18688/g.46695 Transcript_18688/m.46695 type:complete len:157 (-) Transcript_18688:192-662(-)